MRCSSLDFTAKPTPWLRREPSGTPFQKKVYPAPASVKESSPCSLVSLRAAMSMLYLASSRATSAVLRWGLSGVSARSSSVRKFHEAMLSLFFTLIFRPRGGMLRRLRLTVQSVGSRQFFLTTFSRSFPITGVSSVGLLSCSGSCRKDVLLHPAVLTTITPLPPVCMVWLDTPSHILGLCPPPFHVAVGLPSSAFPAVVMVHTPPSSACAVIGFFTIYP